MKRPWIAFFSQTGSEIANISDTLGRKPDLIITNREYDSREGIDSRIGEIYYIPVKPTLQDYQTVLQYYKNPLITLHGFLRILPKEICESYKVYNGHPGLITWYPELKGKDPQVRAFQGIQEGKYNLAGAVLHEVIPEVDEGKVISEEFFSTQGLSLDDLFLILKERSLKMWVDFLKKKL